MICRRGALAASCAWVLVLARIPLSAQTSAGELRVSVRDTAGAALPATVEISSNSSNTRQTVHLPAEGRYSFKHLPFGFYRVNATQPGFQTATALVEIRSALPKEYTATLSIQPVNTSVDITDAETLVDPDRTSTAYYVGEEQIKDRPTGLSGRGLLDLVAMQPGWILEANGVLHPRESEYETQYIINGFPVQDNRSPAFAPNIEADDVQSMKIYTSGIPAEFGQKVGGVIEVTTDRNASPGFHGIAVAQGGSFDTVGGYLSAQYVAGKTTGTVSAESFLTDRYLDPPVIANYTNHASNASVTGTLERDLNAADRLRISFSRRETHLLVPDELLQEVAGQRQDRTSRETSGQVSYQHVFSAALLGSIRGMVRDVGADLWSNPHSTPIAPRQSRGFREGYANGSLAGHYGRNEWKTGADFRYASLDESFGFHIVSYRVNGFRIYDRDTPADFSFRGHGLDREQSAYAQDLLRFGRLTLSAGVRFDRYSLLVHETAWSPRLGASWNVPSTGTVFHISYDRTFGTPPFENVLVSASPETRALNNAGFYLPVRPSRGNYYEAGFTQAAAKRLRLDASYFLRDVRNAQDDNLLENTGVSFPITFQRARIRGIEVKLQAPKWGPFAGYVSYTNQRGIAEFPIAGGLFLDDNSAALLTSNDRFPVSQDQRNTARAMLRYQVRPRIWTSWSASYNSGLPFETNGETLAFLNEQYGSAVVSKINFSRGRVNPSFSLDASVGFDVLRRERRSISLQADVLNMTDRLNVINFAGFLSGTAIAPPRSFGVRLRGEF